MKKIYLFLTVFALTFSSKAQDGIVEKSIFGVQTGVLGIWFHNESKLPYEVKSA